MSTRPWYRRFPDNFIAGTVGLTLEEKGAYSLVLDLIYVRGGPVPDEPRYIAGVCNCSVRKWNAIRQRLIDLGKIEAVDGVLLNRRAEKELEISSETERERAESGRKGGEKTAENRADTSKNNDVAPATLKHTRASQLQYQYKKKEGTSFSKGKEEPAPPALAMERLDRSRDTDLWTECERIMGKKAATSDWAWSFPAHIVAEARTNLAKPASEQAA